MTAVNPKPSEKPKSAKTQKRLKQSLQVRVVCEQQWPDLFNAKKPKPLAIGIHREIIQSLPDAPVNGVRGFLAYWTRRPSYRRALKATGALRLHLDCSVQGPVDLNHKAS